MSGWAAAAGAAADMIGAGMQASAAKRAAAEQGRAAERALEEDRRQFDLSRSDIAPWREAGGAALSELARRMGIGGAGPAPTREQARQKALEQIQAEKFAAGAPKGVIAVADVDARANEIFGQMQAQWESGLNSENAELTRRFTMSDLERDPVYQQSLRFGMEEGAKGVRRMFGAQGMGRSGAAAKALTRFASDYTGSKAGEAFNRFTTENTNIFNRLSGVSGTGQTAANQVATLGANVAQNAGNLMVGAANARGAATIAGANAWGNALSNVGNRFFTQSLINDANRNNSGSNPNASYSGYSLDQPDYSGGYY